MAGRMLTTEVLNIAGAEMQILCT